MRKGLIASHSSAQIAETVGNRLVNGVLTLTTLPERGRVVPELGDPEVREVIFEGYRTVYRLRPGRVELIRFWHAARGTPEIDSGEFQR